MCPSLVARHRPTRVEPKIDVIFELIDARAPLASRVPFPLNGAAHWLVLTKTDLADPETTASWLSCLRRQAQRVLVMSKMKIKRQLCLQLLRSLMTSRHQSQVCALVTGVANVGKSTFINHLLAIKKTTTGNEPGLTRGRCWLRVNSWCKIMDTPGRMRFPIAHKPLTAQQLSLAWIKAWPYHRLELDAVCWTALQFLTTSYPVAFCRYFGLEKQHVQAWSEPVMLAWATRTQLINSSHNQYQIRFLNDLSRGRVGLMSFERPLS